MGWTGTHLWDENWGGVRDVRFFGAARPEFVGPEALGTHDGCFEFEPQTLHRFRPARDAQSVDFCAG